jgi:hypothetical protein
MYGKDFADDKDEEEAIKDEEKEEGGGIFPGIPNS